MQKICTFQKFLLRFSFVFRQQEKIGKRRSGQRQAKILYEIRIGEAEKTKILRYKHEKQPLSVCSNGNFEQTERDC